MSRFPCTHREQQHTGTNTAEHSANAAHTTRAHGRFESRNAQCSSIESKQAHCELSTRRTEGRDRGRHDSLIVSIAVCCVHELCCVDARRWSHACLQSSPRDSADISDGLLLRSIPHPSRALVRSLCVCVAVASVDSVPLCFVRAALIARGDDRRADSRPTRTQQEEKKNEHEEKYTRDRGGMPVARGGSGSAGGGHRSSAQSVPHTHAQASMQPDHCSPLASIAPAVCLMSLAVLLPCCVCVCVCCRLFRECELFQ